MATVVSPDNPPMTASEGSELGTTVVVLSAGEIATSVTLDNGGVAIVLSNG